VKTKNLDFRARYAVRKR